jgi:uncharacterized protein YuzE
MTYDPQAIIDAMKAQHAPNSHTWCNIDKDGNVVSINWEAASALADQFQDGVRHPIIICAVMAMGARKLALTEIAEKAKSAGFGDISSLFGDAP